MSQTPITIESVLSDATRELAGVSDSPRLDAETLLAWVMDTPRSHLFTHPEQGLQDQPAAAMLTPEKIVEPVPRQADLIKER